MTRRYCQREFRKILLQFTVGARDDRVFAGRGRSSDKKLPSGRKRQQLGTNRFFIWHVGPRFLNFGIAGDDNFCREIELRVSIRIFTALRENQSRVAERIFKQAAGTQIAAQ